MKRGEVLRACAVGMAPVPEQGQCKAPVCMTHTVPVTQWLNQMRSVLVPSSGKVHQRDAGRAQPALFPQCQQLRAGVDVWWVTDLTLSSLGGEKQHPHFEPVEQPPAPFTSPQPHNTSVPLSTAPRFSCREPQVSAGVDPPARACWIQMGHRGFPEKSALVALFLP